MPEVHNKYHNTAPKDAVYIGRGTRWGNPYRISKEVSREQVISLYEEYVELHPSLRNAARKYLKGKDLVCFCNPAACHGDILLKIANEEV